MGNTVADRLGSGSTTSPADEAEFSAIERGIVQRARAAGFSVELVRGVGPEGTSRRASGSRYAGGTGLVQFSLTRTMPSDGTEKSDCWVRFKHWPARPAKLAELRAELVLIASLEGNHA